MINDKRFSIDNNNFKTIRLKLPLHSQNLSVQTAHNRPSGKRERFQRPKKHKPQTKTVWARSNAISAKQIYTNSVINNSTLGHTPRPTPDLEQKEEQREKINSILAKDEPIPLMGQVLHWNMVKLQEQYARHEAIMAQELLERQLNNTSFSLGISKIIPSQLAKSHQEQPTIKMAAVAVLKSESESTLGNFAFKSSKKIIKEEDCVSPEARDIYEEIQEYIVEDTNFTPLSAQSSTVKFSRVIKSIWFTVEHIYSRDPNICESME